MTAQRIEFEGAQGHVLAARLDLPEQTPRAYALFAHCFTCGKDISAARHIARALTHEGIAVLRFDFTGIGHSEGEFANTNFSSNVEDLVAAASHLRERAKAPSILIGHSLGGAAVLAAAGAIPEARAVVTLGAPSDPGHVAHHFSEHWADIRQCGEAEVQLAGRTFKVRKQFLEDVSSYPLTEKIANLRRALLVMHSPLDETVGIESATNIFSAAKHPKSFVTLDTADHLLSRKEDAAYAAKVIAAWTQRYLDR